MRTLTQYLDLARTRQGIDSDRRLGLAMGLTGPIVHYYRKGQAMPSDDAMVNLATLAGVDPAEALLDLNQWRAKGAARSVYVDMARRLQGTAASLIVAVSFAAAALGSLSAPSQATSLQPLDNLAALERSGAGTHNVCGQSEVYIMR